MDFQGKLSELENQKDPPVRCTTPLCVTLDQRKDVKCADPGNFEIKMPMIIESIQRQGRLHGVDFEIKFEMEAPNSLLLCNS